LWNSPRLAGEKTEVEELGEKMEDKIRGRYLAQDALDEKGKVIAKANTLIDEKLATELGTKCQEVMVRSPLTCETSYGLCQKCYGLDLGWLKPIDLGEAVGVVAAQAIGEPGTQLTLRTFHTGGVAQAVDITQGLPRVEELVEARAPKGEAPLSEINGEVIEIEKSGRKIVVRIKGNDNNSKENNAKSGNRKKSEDLKEYSVPEITTLWVKLGDQVKKGDQLCEGNLNLKKLLKLAGKEATQKYILKEIKKVYNLAGEKINDKHLEIIIRQMFSRVKIIDSGESDFIIGEIIEKEMYQQAVRELKAEKKKPPEAEEIVLGIKNVALTSSSVLAPASFQETTRVLVKAALEGRVDYLRGLKENVIIGRLIPAGTGFRRTRINPLS